MKTKLMIIAMIFVMVLAFALPFLANTSDSALAAGPGDCDYGGTHSGLAKSGMTGQGPNRGGHVPGGHRGASGFCGIGG